METQVLERIDITAISIRNYRDGDQKLLADMINETDQVDRFDRRTTEGDLQHEWEDPHFTPAKDGFVAVVVQDGAQRAIAAGDVYLGVLDGLAEKVTVYGWHVVRPEWRGSGVGRQIIEVCYGRARELVAEIADPRPKVFRASAHAADVHARRRLEQFGMEHVRTFYTMEYAPLDATLQPPDAPAGLSIVPWTPEYDQATMDTFNESFRDHWGFRNVSQEEWQHWFHDPKSRPDLWRIAVDDATGEVAGICVVGIDPDKNEALGRQEGWVHDLGVRRPWRKRGLGTALLLAGMATLCEAGMTSARLGVDSDSLTDATRIYERVGYRVVSEWHTYHKLIEQ